MKIADKLHEQRVAQPSDKKHCPSTWPGRVNPAVEKEASDNNSLMNIDNIAENDFSYAGDERKSEVP